MSALLANGICKSFGATAALTGVDFDVQPGEVHALVGENGSGKSTLMRIFSGEEIPDRGSLTVRGEQYSPRSPIDARRHGIVLIHQELALCEHLSIAENIFLGGEPRFGPALKGRAMIAETYAVLARMGYSGLEPETRVSRLSPAMKQVVEIAKGLARNASIFIFDEPTSSLGKDDVESLFNQIRLLRERGCAVIYISHFLDEVMEIADRATVLRDGKSVGTSQVSEIDTAQLIELMVGREVTELYPRSQHVPGEIMLELKVLAGRKKPAGADLTVRRGEVFGIAGLNGSGRTELLRCIFGLDRVISGKVRIAAFSAIQNPHDLWRNGVGFLCEDRKLEGLALKLSLAENLLMPYPGSRGLVSPNRQRERTQAWIERLGVRCKDSDQPVGQLSGGNQQKIALGRLLERDVDLLLLDEPTRGIDIGSKAEIYRVIDELASNGKAVLMVSSYLPELLGVCDRIAVMARGRLGPPVAAESTDAEALMEAAVGG